MERGNHSTYVLLLFSIDNQRAKIEEANMSKAANKAARLMQIEALLLAHPEGLKAAEIARKFEVNRSTITRCLPDLPKHIYVDDFDEDRWKIDRSNYLVNLKLSLHEAMAIHLSTRLLANHMDKKSPHAASALRKLGESLSKLAPTISQHLNLSAEVMDDESTRHDPRFLEVVEKLTLAWAEQKRVKIWHRSKNNRIYDYDFASYLIEPYAAGKTSHVLGVHGANDKRITFKMERIERIESRQETYVIPNDFDPREYLRDTWGIWYSESEPQEVVLKFHPRVVRRVLETTWHTNEEKNEQPDGYLIWTAKIAEPQEMMPWIRGWGADVKVLEPRAIREMMMGEARAMTELYNISNNSEPGKKSTIDDFFGDS